MVVSGYHRASGVALKQGKRLKPKTALSAGAKLTIHAGTAATGPKKWARRRLGCEIPVRANRVKRLGRVRPGWTRHVGQGDPPRREPCRACFRVGPACPPPVPTGATGCPTRASAASCREPSGRDSVSRRAVPGDARGTGNNVPRSARRGRESSSRRSSGSSGGVGRGRDERAAPNAAPPGGWPRPDSRRGRRPGQSRLEDKR